jgi:hypothetical protein
MVDEKYRGEKILGHCPYCPFKKLQGLQKCYDFFSFLGLECELGDETHDDSV